MLFFFFVNNYQLGWLNKIKLVILYKVYERDVRVYLNQLFNNVFNTLVLHLIPLDINFVSVHVINLMSIVFKISFFHNFCKIGDVNSWKIKFITTTLTFI